MPEANTAFVFDPDPVERAWIVSALTPVVDMVVTLEASPTVAGMLRGQKLACLIASAEPEENFVLALVRELRRSGSALPAIILGSHSAFRTAIEIARLDGTTFLERPLTTLQLRSAVRRACQPGA